MKRVEPGERAALYYRVSSEEQEKFGISLDAQRERLVEYAKENKLRIVGEFRDGGFSARKKWKSRPAFVSLIDAVKREEIDIILFIKLDRWFRNIADYYEVQQILDAHKVRWIAIMEDYDTTTANGRLNLNIKLSIAQDEADRTAERIKFVFDEKIKNGEVISGKVPLGYKIENKKPVIDPEAAPLAVEIFQHYIANRSIREVQRWLAAEKGMKISTTMVRCLIGNERYTGTWFGVKGFSPALIDEKTFRTAQEILSVRSQRNAGFGRTDRVYLFTGLLFCAECGRRMKTYPVYGYVYYKCQSAEQWGNCSLTRKYNEKQIEKYLLDNIVSIFEGEITAREEKKAAVRDKTPEIKRKIARLQELYINDLIDMDSYKAQYAELAQLLSQQETPVEEPDIEEILDPLSAYESMSRAAKKAFWSWLIKRIYVDNDTVTGVELNI